MSKEVAMGLRFLSLALCLCLLGWLGATTPVHGQGVLNDGVDARFEWNAISGTRGSADLQPEGTTDHVFQFWWYFRIDGDSSETFFPWFPTSQVYAGNVATIDESFPLFDSNNVTTLS